MSADNELGLCSQFHGLNDMDTSIESIVDNFDDVLTKPYLDQFSATLNTVPVISLRNSQIIYLDTKLDPIFTAFPTGAKVSVESNIHFFPTKVVFEADTYTIADKTPIEFTSEFTATNLGPVIVRSDGYLYKRYFQDPPSTDSDPMVQWYKRVL
ncbi:hypothetical protein F4820DRAFT_450302 [Hypoxylon rubiginosum]|uniref:Uncharacterized protein n=1 Tax=Hypoxylon rubiginosum TaxID=110542 RepID=A0ACB9YUR6_9PEZI|nr:hypothetical protein F4820DRAFT_450302 [Hypoxylon rubiginosum]